MSESYSFARVILLVAIIGLGALLSNRLAERIRIPAPLLVLVAAAVAVNAIPHLHQPPERLVDQLVTIALIAILFEGGMHIGRDRFRSAAVPITVIGVLGTFLTVAGAASFIHYAFGLNWYLALLVATAISPTDPAVVFSVLGRHELAGRSGTILEGESGANDPVGIALMAGLISAGGLNAGGLNAGAFAHIAAQFALQMSVGIAVGLFGGQVLLWFSRSVSLPGEGLYPLRSAAGALALFGAATLAHGSGFLAVFVAGIVIGDERAPYKREVQRFHSALASLGEIVAFVVLGLTVDLKTLTHADVWLPGLIIAVVLAFVLRPVLVGICLLPARLATNERNFVLLAGLKGAVPILLGSLVLEANVPQAHRLYGIIVVVVVFSVLVQGSLTPLLARWSKLPMTTRTAVPWALGVRLAEEPTGTHYLTVGEHAPADGCRIEQLPGLPEDVWISLVVRADELLPVNAQSRLRAGDRVLLLADPDRSALLETIFSTAASP